MVISDMQMTNEVPADVLKGSHLKLLLKLLALSKLCMHRCLQHESIRAQQSIRLKRFMKSTKKLETAKCSSQNSEQLNFLMPLIVDHMIVCRCTYLNPQLHAFMLSHYD